MSLNKRTDENEGTFFTQFKDNQAIHTGHIQASLTIIQSNKIYQHFHRKYFAIPYLWWN